MKKFFATVLSALLICLTFGCGEGDAVQVYVPDGAPALAVANLMKEKKAGGRAVEIHVVTPAVIRAKLTNGEADLAIAPTNLGAQLYQGGIDLKMVSANTYGLLYLVGKKTEQVESLADLKGKVVHVIGEGQTPDLVLRYVLAQAGIEVETSESAVADKVAIRYAADGTSLMQAFAAGRATFGVLGEPAATNAIGNEQAAVRELFDLQREFQAASGAATLGYPQASLFARGEFLENNAAFADAFLEKMRENLDDLQEHPQEAADLLASEEYGGSRMKLTAAIVARMNLRVVPAANAKADVEAYLGMLNIPAPQDGFYRAA